MLATKQKLILFFISCEPGVKDIYRMVKLYDRANFPFQVMENLKPLQERDFIRVCKYFDNGTPSEYAITEAGKAFIRDNFNQDELISYIKTLENPEQLLDITQSYIDKKNGL